MYLPNKNSCWVKMRNNIVKCLILCILAHVSNSARILGVYPAPSISHQVVFQPVMKELARRGHEVIVITPYPENIKLENYTEIDVSDVSVKRFKETFITRINKDTDNAELVHTGIEIIDEIFEMQLQHEQVQELIKSKVKIDLVFTEAVIRPSLILAHIFDAPAIQFSSFMAFHPNYPQHGSIGHPLIHGEPIRSKLYNLTLWDKFEQLHIELKFRYLQSELEKKEDLILKRCFGPKTPTVQELSDRAELLFLNVNPIFEGNRAVPPGVIHLGGLHQKPYKELPTDLKSYLDSSKHGVIYMSFGSNVDPTQLPPEKIQVFCRVFSRLPYEVLWKWNDDELPGKPDNVRISKWLPQSDLLRHPKIKLFITQGGLQSSDEAITAGVPLLTIPIFGDQWYNAEQQVRLKIAAKIELPEIEDDTLEGAITRVIDDPSYRQSMGLLRERILDQPQTPLERAIWWTEYVLRHKSAKHLRSPMANISWTEYLMLDVVATVLALLVLSVYIVLRITRSVFSIFRSESKLKTA